MNILIAHFCTHWVQCSGGVEKVVCKFANEMGVSNALCKFFFTFLEEINHITISRSSGRMRSPN